jgi:alpha-beta hydrolase superfamily lysophospholipase
MKLLRILAFAAFFALLGVLAVVGVGYALYIGSLPPLARWHTTVLEGEYRAGNAQVRSWADWLALEEGVFAQLRQHITARPEPGEGTVASRYTAGSLADPTKEAIDWNRSFELVAPQPRGGVLLLHGLSDSPYSLRALAERMHADGWTVVGLRLPGHGALPSGLLEARWEDWAAAARIAARHLRSQIGDKPLLIAGYSTGAALAVEYALARLQGEDLPAASGLLLFSPAIGVSPAAGYAVWQARIAHWLGIPELEWTDVQPEYDPYKFASFTVNAGDQAHRLTRHIQGQLDALGKGAPVRGVPPILAFQSVADATVSTPAVVGNLFSRLAPEGHELVFYDLNRHAEARPLYRAGALAVRENLLRGGALPFTVTALANTSPSGGELSSFHRAAGSTEVQSRPTGLTWPAGVYSLSHVALPFTPDDPVYGSARPEASTLPYLGRLELQGERGVLAIPDSALLRLRHNPFAAYQQARVKEFADAIAR